MKAAEFIQKICFSELEKKVYFIFSDSHFQRELILDVLKQRNFFVKNIKEETLLSEIIDNVSCGSLFGEENITLFSLKAQDQNKIKASLDRLPGHLDQPIFSFSSLKNRFSDAHPASILIPSFPPFERDIPECISTLVRYLKITSVDEESLIYRYGCDLFSLYISLKHIKMGLPHEGESVFSPFELLDPLVKKDLQKTFLFLSTAEAQGEQASVYFYALLFFMKQLVSIHAHLQQEIGTKSLDLKTVLNQLKIPFSAHDRIKKAIETIPIRKVQEFLEKAADIELAMRQQKKPFTSLTVELALLLN